MTVLFACLAVRHADVLWLPPYEDQAIGLWAEADYLVEHNFDYRKLRYDEPHFNSPQRGARSYMVSVMPTLTALLMKYGPSREAGFFAAHLIALAWAAIVGWLVYAMLRERSRWIAALAAAATLTTPLLEVQAEMLGMDTPVAVCALLTALCVLRERYLLAAALGTLAFLVKPTGALATAVTLCCLALRSALLAGPARHRALVGLAVNAAALALQIAIFRWGDPLPELRTPIPWPRTLLFPLGLVWFPDVAAVTALALCLTVAWLVRQRRDLASAATPLVDLLRRHAQEPLALFSWLMIAGMFASMARWIAVPRYFTTALPFVYLALITAGLAVTSRRWLGALLTVVLIVNVANRSGRGYPEIRRVAAADLEADALISAHSCAFLERSREYLREQHSLLEIFRTLEAEHPRRPLLAPGPYSFLASRPRLGYVTRPLETYDAGDFAQTMQTFCRLEREARAGKPDRQPLLFGANMSRVTLPPYRDGDTLVAHGLSPDIQCYFKSRDAVPADDAQLEAWYLDQTWQPRWTARRAIERTVALAQHGQTGRALNELQQALHTRPLAPHMRDGKLGLVDVRQRVALGQRLGQLERTFPGVARVDARLAAVLASYDLLRAPVPVPAVDELSTADGRLLFLFTPPFNAADPRGPGPLMPLEQALFCLGSNQLDEALVRFDDLARGVDSTLQADGCRIVVAAVRLLRGEPDEAERTLQRLADPGQMPEREWMLALIAWQRGEAARAVELSQAALQTHPQLTALHKIAALGLARQRQGAAAAEHLRQCETDSYGDVSLGELLRSGNGEDHR